MPLSWPEQINESDRALHIGSQLCLAGKVEEGRTWLRLAARISQGIDKTNDFFILPATTSK